MTVAGAPTCRSAGGQGSTRDPQASPRNEKDVATLIRSAQAKPHQKGFHDEALSARVARTPVIEAGRTVAGHLRRGFWRSIAFKVESLTPHDYR